MKLEYVVNIEDLHGAAKRRIPRAAFDYFEGGVEDELGLARNGSRSEATASVLATSSTCRRSTRPQSCLAAPTPVR